jgi:hypothetical protein
MKWAVLPYARSGTSVHPEGSVLRACEPKKDPKKETPIPPDRDTPHGIPLIPEIEFFDATNETDRELFKLVGVPLLDPQKVLTDFVLPNLNSQPLWLFDRLMDFRFDELPLAAKSNMINHLRTRPFVIVSDKQGQLSTSVKRVKPSEVVDKNSKISRLYSDDEKVFVTDKYSSGVYHQNLILLGMKTRFDGDIADNRIKYLNSHHEEHGMFDKCRDLLLFLNNCEGKFPFRSEWLPFIKLPALKDEKRMVLSSTECRPKSFAPLVEGVLGIVPIRVDEFLYKLFGWDRPLEADVLASRINIISAMTSSSDVQMALFPVLEYINMLARAAAVEIEKFKAKLSSRPWLPGSLHGLWLPERVFFIKARAFEPYLAELPIMWSNKFSKILRLFGVSLKPTSDHLLDFIASLDTTAPLSNSNLDAVILALQRIDSDFTADLWKWRSALDVCRRDVYWRKKWIELLMAIFWLLYKSRITFCIQGRWSDMYAWLYDVAKSLPA